MTVAEVATALKPVLQDAFTSAGLPHRFSLSRAALEQLAERLSVPLPWDPVGSRSALADRLSSRRQQRSSATTADVVAELTSAALLVDGQVPAEVARALRRFAEPGLTTTMTLSMRRADGVPAQLSSWHRLVGSDVTSISASATGCELAWRHLVWWPHQLTTFVAAGVRAECASGREAQVEPTASLEWPMELLTTALTALGAGRDDLVPELIRLADGPVTASGRELEAAEIQRQLKLLHESLSGRLLARVEAPDAGHSGLLSWLLHGDGWREMVPLRRRRVALTRVEPAALGRRVLALCREVTR